MLQLLNLSGKQLPASSFPERADAYVCDKCGRDVTPYLRRGRADLQPLLGPAMFRCDCGEEYLSASVEWDHLGPSEREKRIRQIIASAENSLFVLAGVVFLLHQTIKDPTSLLLSLSFIGAYVAAMCVVDIYYGVAVPLFRIAASVVRTRRSRNSEPAKL